MSRQDLFPISNETIGTDPKTVEINVRISVGCFPFIQEPPKRPFYPLERILNIIFCDFGAYFPSQASREDPYYCFWEVAQTLVLDVNSLRM